VDRIDPAALDAEPVETPLDPLTPIHHLGVLPAGERLAGPQDAARLTLAGAALAAGTLLGVAETTAELAVAYAKEREQFDRPIGSFQAVKHILADMFVRQEAARAAAYAAGAEGSFYETDLDLNNADERDVEYRMIWLPRARLAKYASASASLTDPTDPRIRTWRRRDLGRTTSTPLPYFKMSITSSVGSL